MGEEGKIIEIEAVLEYKDGQVFIKKMNTTEMPAMLTFGIMEALNNAIVEYHKDDIAIKLMSFTAMIMAERSVKMNAADLSVSTELEMEHMKYFTRLSSITFKADKKPLEKRAREIAKNIFKINEINSIDDVQAMLEKAVLAGYNLRKEDFEED